MNLSHKAKKFGMLAFLGAIGLGGSAEAEAQGWERMHVEPRTEWAGKGRQIGKNVMQGLARTAREEEALYSSMMAAGALEGSLQQIVIPVAFSDETLSFSRAEIQDRVYGQNSDGEYSLTEYWEEVSYNIFSVTGMVAPVITLPESMAYYVGDRAGWSGTADNLDQFLQDVLAGADSVIGDWNNLLAEPVEGGRVPAVVILAAGQGGHCAGDNDHIWPHRYHATGVLGEAFETSSTTPSGEVIVIDDYIVQGVAACGSGEIDDMGVVIHETGHLVGLPDLYSVEDPHNDGPVGHWDLMATGNYNMPHAPAHLGAWSRAFMGWANLVELSPDVEEGESTNLSLEPVADGGEIWFLPYPTHEEFLLLESRAKIGSDRFLKDEGMLIWYVNNQILEENYLANRVNDDPANPAVAVIQADGRTDLQEGRNRADAGDVWPGATQNTRFSTDTSPESSSPVAGAAWPFALSGISQSGTGAGSVVSMSLSVLSDVDSPQGELEIRPDSLPVFAVGEEVWIQLELVGGDTIQNVGWTADEDVLQSLGLTLSPVGALNGTFLGAAGPVGVTVSAVEDNGVLATKNYVFKTLQKPSFTTEDAVRGLIDPTYVLDPEVLEYLDTIGNKNGVLDLGDLVKARAAGVIERF